MALKQDRHLREETKDLIYILGTKRMFNSLDRATDRAPEARRPDNSWVRSERAVCCANVLSPCSKLKGKPKCGAPPTSIYWAQAFSINRATFVVCAAVASVISLLCPYNKILSLTWAEVLKLMRLPSTTTSLSCQMPPPCCISSGTPSCQYEVSRLPFTNPAEISVYGPWQIAATGLLSARNDLAVSCAFVTGLTLSIVVSGLSPYPCSP